MWGIEFVRVEAATASVTPAPTRSKKDAPPTGHAPVVDRQPHVDARQGPKDLGTRTPPASDGPPPKQKPTRTRTTTDVPTPHKAPPPSPSSSTNRRGTDKGAPDVNFVTAAMKSGKKLVIAHRGGGGSPNVTTLDGIRAQARHGKDPVEVRTRRLGDGTIVAYPHETLSGGSKDGTKLSDVTLKQLRAEPEYQYIPTLDEVGETAAAAHVTIAVDVEEDTDEQQQREIVRTLERHLPTDKVALFSRDEQVDAKLKASDPKHRIKPLEVDPATTPGEEAHAPIDALRKAAMDGISDAVEVDWNRLKDGTVVAAHDPALDEGPLKGTLLADLTLDDLRAAGYDDIPTVDEYGEQAAKLGVNVVADIKSSGEEVDVVEGLLRHLPESQLTAFSFEPDVVRTLDEKYPDIPIGFLPRQYDSSNTGERLRQKLLGDAIDQIEDLGIRPDYIEVSSNNVNTEVLDYAGDRDIGVVAGGTSSDDKVNLYEDPRVLGFMIDASAPMPGLDAERYDADEHGTIDGPDDQQSLWSGIPLLDRIPGSDGVLRKGANKVYSYLSGTEDGQRLVHRAVNAYNTAHDTVVTIGHGFGATFDAVQDGVSWLADRGSDGVDAAKDSASWAWEHSVGGIGDGDDDVKYVPFL